MSESVLNKNIFQSDKYIYENRIVIFLDVLGFKNKLDEFEKEANDFFDSEINQYFISSSVNTFIETFNTNIKILKDIYKDEMSHYLFSDNMCLSINYGKEYDTFIDVLFTVCDLFRSFAEKGYFLRGAVDVGLFIDKSDLAIGTPLARAYELETNSASFPRFLISGRYIEKIKSCILENSLSDQSLANFKLLVKKSCEYYYLNIFGSVITIASQSGKQDFFKNYYDAIQKCLKTNQHNEKIYIKYNWLKEEMVSFIKEYIDDINKAEPDLDSEISSLNQQEITELTSFLRSLTNNDI